MKKILILTMMPILLASCTPKNDEQYENYEKWTIVTPTGAPAIAMSYFSGFENFQTNSDATNIVAMMTTGTPDIAILPTNVGIQAIRKGNLSYKLLASITSGNIYIASTGHDNDGVMGEDDYIVSFQQGAVPDKLFHYVYGNDLNNALHYVSSAQEAAKCLKMGKNLADDGKSVDYVVLAEPALTSVLSTTPTASEYADLQELYNVKSNGSSIYQASIFVKNGLDQHTLMEPVLGNLRQSIAKMNEDPSYVVPLMNQNSNPEATFGVKPEIAKQMFEKNNRMHIECNTFSTEAEQAGLNIFLSIFGLEEIKIEEIA